MTLYNLTNGTLNWLILYYIIYRPSTQDLDIAITRAFWKMSVTNTQNGERYCSAVFSTQQ